MSILSILCTPQTYQMYIQEGEEKRKSAHTKILTQKPTKSRIAKTQQRRHSDKSDEKTKLLSSSTWSEQIKYINTVLIIIYCISNTLIRFDRMVVAVWDGVKSIKPSNTTKKIVLVSLAMQHIQHITKTSICALCMCGEVRFMRHSLALRLYVFGRCHLGERHLFICFPWCMIIIHMCSCLTSLDHTCFHNP